MVILFLVINKLNFTKKYTKDTKIEIFRSLNCTYFFLNSLAIILTNINSIVNPEYFEKDFNDLILKFLAYLATDLILFISFKKKFRFNLILHHIIIITFWSLYFIKKKKGNITMVIMLIAESYSIFNFLLKIDKEDNIKNNKINNKITKYRIFNLKYIRLPMWIISFVHGVLIFKKNKYHSIPCILLPFLMVYLDQKWLKLNKKKLM